MKLMLPSTTTLLRTLRIRRPCDTLASLGHAAPGDCFRKALAFLLLPRSVNNVLAHGIPDE
jgi:hypothetical protein